MQPFKLFAWDASTGRFIRVTSDPTGALNTTGGGGGGGGAVTVADGADAAQGTTTDASSANTVIGLLKAIKAAVQGTLTVAGSLGRSWTLSSGTDSVNVGNFPATQPVSGTVAISTSPVHVDDNAGSLTVDAPVGTPVFARLSDGAAALVGQKAMASSLPIVVASDQSALPDNIAQVGGTAIAAKAAGSLGQASLPVYPNANKLDTYHVSYGPISTALTAGGGEKQLLSIEHALASTKTVRIRRIIISGWISAASAAVTGNLTVLLRSGTAASSGGAAVTPQKANSASPNAESSWKSGPTIVAAGGPIFDDVIFATAAAGATIGLFFAPITVYDWQENGETQPITLRAGVLETLCLVVNGSWATTAPTLTFAAKVIFTEE